jgi:hypothetical protein
MSYTVRALQALNIHDIIVEGDPSSEEEFFSQSHKIVDHDSNNSAIFSSEPEDFGITWNEVKTKIVELQASYDAQEYARNRASEYPSLLELTVALYDTDDKSAVEAKRAEVKAKYPKPE